MDNSVKNTLRLMAKKHLEQADLARMTNESPQNIHNWLKGRKRIPGDKLFAVAKALEVTADELRYGTEETDLTKAGESRADYVSGYEQKVISDLKKLDDESRRHVLAIIRLLAAR